MEVIEYVVPIVRKEQVNEKWDVQGSGVIIKMQEKLFLATCKHVLLPEKGSGFLLKGEFIPIDEDSMNFKSTELKDIHLPKTPEELEYPLYRPTTREDYAFYLLDGLTLGITAILGDTTNVTDEEELEYIGHNPDNGEQIRIPCKRDRFADEKVQMLDDFGIGRDYLNLIRVNLKTAKPGYSGGPIFRKGTTECIGILRSGDDDAKSITVLKAQTFVDRL